MGQPSKIAIAGTALAAGVGVAGAAWRRQARRSRERVLADPVGEALFAPLRGRPFEVVSVDGTRIHAEAFGPEGAPTVVLGHGWTCSLDFWKLQIRDLSRDHRVVAWDIRGHGRSERPSGGDYSVQALAADLDAVLEASVPAGERALLAGHSMGGMAAVAWAGANPESVAERIGAAALINTGMGGLVAESLVIRSPVALEWTRDLAGRIILTAPGPLPPRSNPFTYELVRYLTLGPDATPAQVAFCERLVLACAPQVRAAFGRTLSELDLADAVASLDAPTLVVAGERDRLTPPVHSRRLAETLPQVAAYVELERIGHMAPVEAPERVTGALRDLAREHLAAPAEEVAA